MRLDASARSAATVALVAFACVLAACGETRKGPGEECLRSDDCLSGFCSARTCVSAPPVGTPAATEDIDAAANGDAGGASDTGAADAPQG